MNYLLQEKCSGWILYIFISGAYILLAFLSDQLIFTDQLYYRSFSDQMAFQSIDRLLDILDKTWWLNYLLQPIFVLLKVTFAVVCITVGVVLMDIEFKINNIINSAIIAEVIFVITHSIYAINLYVNRTELTIESTANYFPFSVLSYFGVENVVSWLHYPLQTLNLFEATFIVFISWLLSKQWKPNFIESLNIVLPSYGIGLLIWMVLIVFLTLQIS